MSQILAIEDSPAIALLLHRRLGMAGHSVDVLPTGDAALDRLGPETLPDVILADVLMPGIDGVETTRWIKRSYPDLPVILVTGQHLDGEVNEIADAIFSKPIDFDGLLEAIERLAGVSTPAGEPD